MSSNVYLPLDAAPVKTTELEGGHVLYELDPDQHAASLLRRLYHAQSTGSSTCDITLCTTDGHEVPFHAVLLAAASSVFRRQVMGNPSQVTNIKISVPMELEVVEVIRDSVYASKVNITPENVGKVKDAAKRYELNVLHQICLQFEQGEESEDEDEEEEEEEEELEDEAEGKSHQAKILSKLRYLFNEEKCTTVTLRDENGDGDIRCHGALLAATSSVFQKMLSVDTRDQRTATLRLEEVTQDALQDILDFVYTAKVIVGVNNVQALLMAACRYQLPGIAKACCNWLSNNLDADNVLGIRWLGRNMRGNYCDQLLSDTNDFIQEYFMDVKESDEFDNLSLEELIEIINDENLGIDSEEDVVYAVMRWVKFDKEQRLHELPTLLQCTRLEHTSLEFLETLCQDPDIQDSYKCKEIIQKAKETFSVPSACRRESPVPFTDQGGHPFQEFSPPTPESLQDEIPIPFIDWDHGYEGEQHSQESYPRTPGSLQDEIPSRQRLRKDGRPDMRYKVNRDEFLEKGRNKNGTLDRRTKECKEILKETPKRKDGKPDMRFRVNRDLLLAEGKKKDGSHDMRFRVNKGAPRSQTPVAPFRSPSGPMKKNGTPDMRFKVNRKIFSDSASMGSSSRAVQQHHASGPLKKDGTPDMRYALNKQANATPQCQNISVGRVCSVTRSPTDRPIGPLKKDGTPDMRYAANKQAHSTPPRRSSSVSQVSPSSSSARSTGPLKRDGTPDMRYAVNRATYAGGSESIGGAYHGRGIPLGSSYATPSYTSYGPLKRDGTPDMRYAANRACYGSSSSFASALSSISGTYGSARSRVMPSYGSSSFTPSGPMKKNGTPDMRFKANRLR